LYELQVNSTDFGINSSVLELARCAKQYKFEVGSIFLLQFCCQHCLLLVYIVQGLRWWTITWPIRRFLQRPVSVRQEGNPS